MTCLDERIEQYLHHVCSPFQFEVYIINMNSINVHQPNVDFFISDKRHNDVEPSQFFNRFSGRSLLKLTLQLPDIVYGEE